DGAVDDRLLADLELAAVQIRLNIAEHLQRALAADGDALAFDRQVVADYGLCWRDRCCDGVQMLLLNAVSAVHAAQLRGWRLRGDRLGLTTENHCSLLPDATRDPHTPFLRREFV